MVKERKNTEAEKKMYACAICGAEYETVAARSVCETECVKKQAEEEKKAVEAKKKAEQAKMKKEVDRAMKIANDLLEKYIEKYGEYEVETKDTFDEDIWPGCLFHYFI